VEAERTVSPRYDPEIAARASLLEVIEQHPTRLTVDELALRITAYPDDRRAVETAREAVRELRRECLVRYRSDDQLVEPTQAALRAYELLTA